MNGGRRMDGIGDNYRIYYQINGSVTAVFIVLIQCYFLFSSRFGLDGFLGALLHTNDELLIGLAAILLDLAMTSGIYLVLKWGYEAWYQRRWIKDHPNLWLRGTWMHIHKKANGVVRTGVVEVKQNYMHIEVRARNYPFPAQGENLVTANQTEWQYYTSVITSDVLGMPDLVGCYIAEKQLDLTLEGLDPKPEIMIPLVATVNELAKLREDALGIIAEVEQAKGVKLDIPIGTMIELPRAAVTADEIATKADFFSFGTNDLTQTTFGFSRDDVESEFIPQYLQEKLLPYNPFATVDPGVAKLVKMGVELGHEGNPNITCGVCGEHGGDPDSIHTFAKIGLDYVSCSPYRVPLARLAAAHAALEQK